jgi:hypothetical protein
VKRAARTNIKIQKPKILVEKMSKKKPAIMAHHKPRLLCCFSKIFIKTTKNKLKFRTIPKI